MRSSRKRPASLPLDPTPGDEIRGFVHKLADQHQQDWCRELQETAPQWARLLALHLRLIELENMESALREFV
ncbi:MAG: hypothetical protein ACLQLC_17890 [Candidatus Sulfotelmatobacter sp.]